MTSKIEAWLTRHELWFQAGSLVIFSFVLASLINLSWGELPSNVEIGRIARQDIRADKDYEIVDQEATERLREEARAKVAKEARKDQMGPINDEEVVALQEKAADEVESIVIKIKAGQSIVRSGDPFDARELRIIDGIRKEKTKTFGRMRLFGTFFFLLLFLSVLFFVLRRSSGKIRLMPKDILFLGTMLITVLLVERIFLFIYGAVRELLPIEIPLASFYGLLPIAFGAMMVRLVLPLPMAILFVPICAALSGFVLQGNLNYALYHLVGMVLGIQLMANVQTRGQILKTGFALGAFQALVLLSLDMVNVTAVGGVMSLEDSGIRVALAFVGGILNAVFVLILMPIFESTFNFLTPIKLLEYGSLNHPLLREMIVRAPGTYHHSHMVGTLAETACEAIGADSLFARVASYFHDIGKMKKSAYFIENQAQGEDRHANLAPSMSALIIVSHVKDGLELAKEYKLPKRIADIIPQHQGTKLISYFYNKAKEHEDPEMHVASDRDYRYPGPKPQTREAGVILLADTVEAATRALKDRSLARLEEVVRNMINKNFIDGQLDECELTLKDLHTIASSFMRILMGIYHQRIEYPPDMLDRMVKENSLEGADADKYKQSTPLRGDSLKEVAKLPPKNLHRIGS